MIKESRFYNVAKAAKAVEDGSVISTSHPFNEIVALHQVDSTGTRQNIDGKLMQLNYGQIVLLKKLPLRDLLIAKSDDECLAVTMFGNNLKVTFDQDWATSQFPVIAQAESSREEANRKVAESGSYYSPEALIEYAKSQSPAALYFHGFEPTACWDYVYDVAIEAQKAGLKMCLKSNGYFSETVFEEMADKIDTVILELHSLQPFFYKKHLKANLEVVTENIRKLVDRKVNVELSTLVIPGENDADFDIESFIKFIKSLGNELPWQISRFYPEYRVQDKEATPISTLETIVTKARKSGVNARVV